MSACTAPLPFETLVAYWAGELAPAANDDVEEHLFACDACARASARIAAITERLRALVPPIVSRALVDSLRARGRRVEDNVVAPEARSHVVFADQEFIIHHLSGMALADAARVRVSVRVEESGEVLAEHPEAPFDAEAGEVLVACQRHFAAFPPNVVFVVTATAQSGAERTARFFVSHEFRLSTPGE